MLSRPISSPQITRMLGFFSAASAGTTVHSRVAAVINRDRPIRRSLSSITMSPLSTGLGMANGEHLLSSPPLTRRASLLGNLPHAGHAVPHVLARAGIAAE